MTLNFRNTDSEGETDCTFKNVFPEETENELAETARKVWNGWQVNLNDIDLREKPVAIVNLSERVELQQLKQELSLSAP